MIRHHMIKIDLRSNVPAYLQIIQQVQEMIQNGVLHPGDQLPTVRQLATQLSINFNTIARAYRLLDEAGFITTQHGRGTYVLKQPGLSQHQPAPKPVHLRAEMLTELTAGYLADAAHLGSTAEDVLEEINKQLSAQWKQADQ